MQLAQRRKEIIWVIIRVAIALVATCALFSAAYFLSRWVFQLLDLNINAYAHEMAAVATALCLMAIVGAIFFRSGVAKRQEAWQSLLDAIRQIAQGNFRFRIDLDNIVRHEGPNHPVQQLVDSVNSLAEGLAKLESMRQEFIGNVSHEIQIPLAAIGGFASILKQGDISEAKQAEYLEIICLESERLSRMTESLLKLTSLESGYHPLRQEEFWGDRQIGDVVLALEPLWSKKDLSLEIALPPFSLRGDRDLVSQIWVNCISNAIKFTPAGGTIKILANAAVGGVEVSLTDIGVAISPDDFPRVFERFYKVDPSRGRAVAGSGLGLAVVKKIVEIHGGTVTLDSRLGEGTLVAVWLPKGMTLQTQTIGNVLPEEVLH